MKIMKTIEKFPGGMMVIPLLLGAFINTLDPNALKIGSFTTAALSNAGANAIVGLQIFFVGTNLKIRDVPEAMKRGSVLLLSRFLVGLILLMLVGKLCGIDGFWGISLLAVLSCAVAANGSLYLSLMGTYGEPIDTAAQGIMALHDGPFLSLILLGVTGLAFIPFISLWAAVLPIVVGFILGNLDEDIRKFCKPGIKLMIPFSGFTIGAGINFSTVAKSGVKGIVLGLIVFGLSAIVCIFADKFINRRPGYAGAAVTSIAGNTLANPTAIAAIIPAYQPYVEIATTQMAAAVVLLILLVPPFTGYIAKKFGCPKYDSERELVDNTVLENNVVMSNTI